MGALARATEDEARGDLGRARERLGSYLCARGYDAAVLARLGHLCLRMGDLREAGRYFLTSDAEGAEVEAAVDAFVAQHHGRPEQLLSQLPAYCRRPLEGYPATARGRLERLAISTVKYFPARSAAATINAPAVLTVLAAVAAVGAALILIGLWTVVRWLVG